MKKNNINIVIIIFYLCLSIKFCISSVQANEKLKFFSLKNSEVNLRIGPSFEHPIKLIYKKKYLPVIVIDKSETWRKIKDFENNSGWVHITQLSKKKTAININNNSILYSKATIYSKPLAKLEMGRLVLVKKCKIDWCKILSGNFSGWIKKTYLWGRV
jgi:SH3-like domain-containing protein